MRAAKQAIQNRRMGGNEILGAARSDESATLDEETHHLGHSLPVRAGNQTRAVSKDCEDAVEGRFFSTRLCVIQKCQFGWKLSKS